MTFQPLPRLSRFNFASPAGLALAVGLLFALAGFFRVWELGSRSLWTDEAWVALAALKASPSEALAAGTSTPPFYMLTLWGLGQLLGGSEAVLRSPSLLFGMGTLILFWLLARTLAGLPAALLAQVLVGFSPIMVYFSKELKQYSGDAFFAVLLFFLVERLLARRGEKGWIPLALAGVLGLGFSHALVFILPVAGGVLWVTLPSSRGRLLILGAVWSLTFAAYYVMFFRRQVDPELVVYWAQDFPDFSGVRAFAWWLGGAWARYFHYFLGEWGVWLGPPLLLAGGAALIKHGGKRALVYFLGPLLITLVAAALHRYPFMGHYNGSRLMLFSAPFLYLVAAAGLAAVLTRLWPRRKAVALALIGLVLVAFHPMELIQENLHTRNNRREIRPLVRYLESQVQPQDLVYVYFFAISPVKYYLQRPLNRVCWGKTCEDTDLALPPGPPPRRVWLIASHFPDLDYMRKFAWELLGTRWEETACLTQEGAVLFKFERQEPGIAGQTGNLRLRLP